MKTLIILFVLTLLIQAVSQTSATAQAYSARRLTQKVAPQTSAPGTVPVPPAAPAPVVQAPVDPVKAQAEKDEATRKAAEFRKKQAEENSGPAEKETPTTGAAPVGVSSEKVEPDPHESLNFVNLTVTNSVPKAISRITMRMSYYDARGVKLKEWITRRSFDPPIGGKTKLAIPEPGYFMPLTTRRVDVEVEEVRFADGTTWAPPPAVGAAPTS